MQSLILVASLILSGSDTPIATFDSAEDLSPLIQEQVNKVRNIVLTNVAVDAQDTFLYQAKLAMDIAKSDVILAATYELASE